MLRADIAKEKRKEAFRPVQLIQIKLDPLPFQGLNCRCYVLTHEVDLVLAGWRVAITVGKQSTPMYRGGSPQIRAIISKGKRAIVNPRR